MVREQIFGFGIEFSVFFGKPHWVRSFAASLNFSERDTDLATARAWESASQRTSIIHGNESLSRYQAGQAIRLRLRHKDWKR